MASLRPQRLLGAIEAGTTLGPALQGFLLDAGRNAEFAVLLASRGQARRMASAPTTMLAITGSAAAIDTVFKTATAQTNAAAAAVAANDNAMTTVTASKPALDVVAANLVSWGLFRGSSHYEKNARTVIARLASLAPETYPTVDSLVVSPTAMAAIVQSATSIAAVAASAPTVAAMVNNSTAFGLIADNAVAIDTIAKEPTAAVLTSVAASTIAMGIIASATRTTAMARMAAYPVAITAISSNPTAWATYRGSVNFANNLAAALANMIGVSPATFDTIDKIIANAAALAKVAASTAAVQALASNSAAMTTLSTSPNLGIILGSSIAMDVIGPNTTAMTSFLNSSGAWAGLFASSVAKGFIVSSTPLVNVIAGNSALITYLTTLAVTNVTATGLPDGNATSMQPFNAAPALPAKLLTLSAKETGIAATYSNYNFGGSVMAGANAGATLSLSGTGPGGQPAHIAGYTGMTWNFQGIGVTAATLPVITYISMM